MKKKVFHFTTAIKKSMIGKIQSIDIDKELDDYFKDKGENILWVIEHMDQSTTHTTDGNFFVTTTLLVNYREG